jgi:hypothetical protein
MSIDSTATENWRQICLGYYMSLSNDAKECQSLRLMEWFDSFAPKVKNSPISITIRSPGSINQHNEDVNRKLGVNIEDLMQKNESLWYFLDDIRKKARQEAHAKLMMQRKEACLKLLHSTALSIESDIENGGIHLHTHILHKMKLLLSHAASDLALLPSVIGGIYNWIRLQLLHHDYSLSWMYELDMLFEREPAAQSLFGAVVYSLGRSLNDDESDSPIVVMRHELSNPFLNRIRRMIEKCYAKSQVSLSKITQDPSTVTASLIRRTNTQGEHDDVSSTIANLLLLCPIL